MVFKPPYKLKHFAIFGIAIVSLIGVCYVWSIVSQPPKSIITTSFVSNPVGGSIKGSNNSTSDKTSIQTKSSLVFTSDEFSPDDKNSNAAIVTWHQVGDNDTSVVLQVRTFNGQEWSPWTAPSDTHSERKDGDAAALTHETLVLASSIGKIQYKFVLTGSDTNASDSVDTSKTKIQLINSSTGPSIAKKQDGFIGFFASLFNQHVSAYPAGPRVISRLEWGVPTGDTKPEWDPEYAAIGRAIVHHTTTTDTPDSAAAVRAIWQYHTYNNDWGDIGYNYLVDSSGNIFQGRYFDAEQAKQSNGDVVAGHAYGNNRGTTGVAAIGNYTSKAVPERQIESIANIIGFKLAPYGIVPSGWNASGPNTVGHRDVGSTSCPGQVLYDLLGVIRQKSDTYYTQYRSLYLYDFIAQGQGVNGVSSSTIAMRSRETKTVHFDLMNAGSQPWKNTGPIHIRLGTEQSRDRNSRFFAKNNWINPARPATFTGRIDIDELGKKVVTATDEILPNQTARFSFPITAPDSGGIYTEVFSLVAEGQQWFRSQPPVSFRITVTPNVFSWSTVGQHIYTNETKTASYRTTDLTPGEKVYLVLQARNTGNTTWYRDGDSPVRLGTTQPQDKASRLCTNTWLSCNRPAALDQPSVEPGAIGTFSFWITAPSDTNGFTGTEWFRPVAEGYTWMENNNSSPGASWPISVYPTKYEWSHISTKFYNNASKAEEIIPSTVKPNQRFYAVLRVRNDTSYTWDRQNNIVNLGTTLPNDRSSGYCDTTWIFCGRITRPIEDAVTPGGVATYEFWMTAPAQLPRVRVQENLGLVNEAKWWMRNKNLNMDFR